MSEMRETTDMVEERPHLSIPQPKPREKTDEPLNKTSENRRIIEIDLVSSKQDVFTIDL